MEKYNYMAAVTADARRAILENMNSWRCTNRLDLESMANSKLWADDYVTGNKSGCYCRSIKQAEECLCHNWDLLDSAISELGLDDGVTDILEQGALYCDVIVRLHVLEFAIGDALDELESEGKIKYSEEK